MGTAHSKRASGTTKPTRTTKLPFSLRLVQHSYHKPIINVLKTKIAMDLATARKLHAQASPSRTGTSLQPCNYDSGALQKLADVMEREFSELICNSEALEDDTGTLDMPSTTALCRQVLATATGPIDVTSFKDQRRLRVVQHVVAFKCFFRRFCLNEEPLTDALIRRTHELMCKHTLWQPEGGQYRIHEIETSVLNSDWAKRRKVSSFPKASEVSSYMANLVKTFTMLSQRMLDTRGKRINPFELASWVFIQFANIRPFANGNGKMCRIIVNAVLYRYLGVVAQLGDDGKRGRIGYANIVRRSEEKYSEENGRVPSEERTSQWEIADVLYEKAGQCVTRMFARMDILDQARYREYTPQRQADESRKIGAQWHRIDSSEYIPLPLKDIPTEVDDEYSWDGLDIWET
ncbi:hypothetical protein TWF696_008838 [Orbilia brochopaga]|uniref:Fido domain-containing protein n=1 Tax=Orbilia brochopaga TaxID=3140254 RepID=A0AAV9UFT2_9PEZI